MGSFEVCTPNQTLNGNRNQDLCVTYEGKKGCIQDLAEKLEGKRKPRRPNHI
jgi:hypothetical protein